LQGKRDIKYYISVVYSNKFVILCSIKNENRIGVVKNAHSTSDGRLLHTIYIVHLGLLCSNAKNEGKIPLLQQYY